MAASPWDALARHRLAPVIALEDAALAAPLADALVAGGLPIAEVTFRTPAAVESLRVIAKRGGLLPIAGTVLTVDQASAAVDAGAQMLVMPGFNRRVVEHSLGLGVAVCPGVVTPTEIEAAFELGLRTMKFFPAEAYGGARTLRALSGPYPQARFLPTGGVSTANLGDYLSLSNVVACGGSWMVKPELYADGNFAAVEKAVEEAVRLVTSISGSA